MPALACMCASLRRASRVLTQQYDEALRPLGLRATQFTVLQALSIVEEVSQGRLGEILAMAGERGLLMPEIRTAVRTGDTLMHERRAE